MLSRQLVRTFRTTAKMATKLEHSSLATLYSKSFFAEVDDDKLRSLPVQDINDKVCVYQGDITKLKVSAIVNAANTRLLGGGGIDGAIHAAAGPELKEECRTLNGAETGQAKITKAYGKLACDHVIHAVGPIYTFTKKEEAREKLISCYYESLQRAVENNLESIAICCISTGVYGYPNEQAAHTALATVRRYLEVDNKEDIIKKVVFCLFLDKDVDIYRHLVPLYFPPTQKDLHPEKVADAAQGQIQS